jgi:hypothetical protein
MQGKPQDISNPGPLSNRTPRKRGRPKSQDTQKKVRQTITLDPGVWEQICEIAKKLEYEGRSPFINDIGTKLTVSLKDNTSKFNEIPDILRIFSCLELPSSRLWSALSFIRAASLRLGLIKHIYENESLVEDVARRSMTILALRSFFEPDNYIANITGYMNWISWHILQAKAGLPTASIEINQLNLSLPQSKKSVDSIVWRLVKTIELLEVNYPGEYLIFYMSMMQRFSGRQISHILKLRDQEITEEQAIDRVKNVMHIFRNAWHNEISKEMLSDKTKDKWMEAEGEVLKTTQRYIELLVDGNLKDLNTRKELELILLTSINRPLLDTFIREVDHAYGHKISNDTVTLNDYQEKIRINLNIGKI